VASILLAVINSLAVAGPAAAVGGGTKTCSAAPTPGPTRHGRLFGLVRPTRVATNCTPQRASDLSPAFATTPPYQGTPPLEYGGGPVMSTAAVGDQLVVTPVFWGPSGHTFTSSYQSVIDGYLANLAHDSDTTTNVFASTFQYAGSNGTINYRMTIGSPIVDTDPLPSAGCTTNAGSIYADGSGYSTCLDDAQVQSEISAVISANHLTNDLGHLVVLFLPKGVESCQFPGNPLGQQCSVNSTASAAYCAYHSVYGLTSAPKVYALLPFPVYNSATKASCTDEGLGSSPGQIQSPNGDQDADVEVSPLSHEMAEAMTDPEGDAWIDSSGGENGDDCAYIYGTLSGTAGALYNQTINGAHYLTQEEFSNAAYVPGVSGCVQGIQPVVPTVSGVSPSSGTGAGGGTVTITGTGFAGASAVHFGAAAAPAYTVNDPTTITATTPAGTAGQVDVTVSTSAGTSATGSGDHYSYTSSAPTVTSVSPNTGPTAGGTTVAIKGTNLAGATAVSVGGQAATGISVASASEVDATVPPGSAGTVDVTVTTPVGTSATSPTDEFTYVAPPAVTSVSPASGPVAGGRTVRIDGGGFSGVTTVSFGGASATNVNVVSASELTVTAPAHATGTVDIRVTTAGGGTSPTTSADRFRYLAPPAVTAVSPSAGPTGGGRSVVITGSGFVPGASVTVGGVAATSVVVGSASSITARVPAHSAGRVDVRVTTPGGTSAATTADRYAYLARPSVSGLSAGSGTHHGGRAVTVKGTGFVRGAVVRFGTALARHVSFLSPRRLKVLTPRHARGRVHVTVTTAGGRSRTTTADRYRFT
jgi:hypothetical protein